MQQNDTTRIMKDIRQTQKNSDETKTKHKQIIANKQEMFIMSLQLIHVSFVGSACCQEKV